MMIFVHGIYTSYQQGVCHTVALPFTLKRILSQKERIMEKLKYFTMQKKILIFKHSSKIKKQKSFKILL